MNRVIKFRGKTTQKEWLFGNLFNSILIKSADGNRACYIFPDNMLADNNGDWNYFAEVAKQYEVDPATVSQFTGIYDKNGHEIYEGDVISFQYGVGLMIYENMSFGIKRRVGIWNKATDSYIDCRWAESMEYYRDDVISAGEVISNMYDNLGEF